MQLSQARLTNILKYQWFEKTESIGIPLLTGLS